MGVIVMLYTVKTYDSRGRFIGVDEFSATDDHCAQAEVKPLLRKDWSQELWCEARRVRAWSPAEEAGVDPGFVFGAAQVREDRAVGMFAE